MEGDFETLLTGMRSSKTLYVILKDMIYNAWDQHMAQINDFRKSLRRDILKIEKQIDGFLDRLVETNNQSTTKAYERKIAELERDKLLANEKLEKSVRPKHTGAQMLELSMRFFANPCKFWETGDLGLRKLVLKLTFAEPLPYHRNEGYRTTKTTLPFNVLGQLSCLNVKWCRRQEQPRTFFC